MTHFLKFVFLLFLIADTCIGFSQAQNTDSILISGKVKWKNKAIRGYPGKLSIISANRQEYICSIDSTGNYFYFLPPGSYTLTPKLHYHWNGDDFIRINEMCATISFNLSSADSDSVPDLILDTIGPPAELPGLGIEENFNKLNTHLLDDYIRKQMAWYEIPGASLAVIKGGKLVYHQVYGVSNNKTGARVTPETLFEAGSVTKPVFAFVVMRLAERNLLNLAQPLYQLLPFDAVAGDERYKLITARHVLSHQSGLPNWGKPDSTGHFRLLFAPGSKFGYSGEGYEYLKRVIEHIMHKDISQVLEDELLVPLQLSGLYFKENIAIEKFAANGHNDRVPTPVRYFKKPMMAFSMFTEAKAFSKFMLALRNKRGLKKKTYEEMFRIVSAREDSVFWSAGFEINNKPAGTSYGHSGGTSSGYICNFRYFPKLDTGYVFFTNSDMGADLSISLLTKLFVTGRN